jgi:AraC family transcriptional regulator
MTASFMPTTTGELKFVPFSTSYFHVEGSIFSDGVTVDIRQYGWDEPCESWIEPKTCLLHYALAPKIRRGSIRIPGQRHYASPGGVVYLPPGAKCLTRCVPEKVRSLCVTIEPDRVEELMEFDAQQGDACLDIRDHMVEHCLARLLQEVREPGFASRVLVESVAATLTVELYRHIRLRGGRSADGAKLPAWRMKRLKERIECDLAGALSVRDLAEECGMSVRHLIRTFKNTEGVTLSDYIARERIARAQERLGSRRALIKEIAGECGFGSPQSFSAAFRKAIGRTPTEYRAELIRFR